METSKKLAVAYLRVSGSSQVDGDGFPRQRIAISVWAKANGYYITKWFEERAIPGKTEWEKRPAWTEMIEELEKGDTIFVERLDRLARDLMVQEHIIADLRKREINLVSVAEPDLCIDDPARNLMRQIMGAINSYDKTCIVAKLAGARKRSREANGRCEGRKPYGEKAGETDTLALMMALRNEGMTFTQVADVLNMREIPTQGGGKWAQPTVTKIIRREEKRLGLAKSVLPEKSEKNNLTEVTE